MRFLSVCSGMEAASVAWEPLGWKAVGFSEIEPFPCAVLAHRFPNTTNYGSLTEYQSWPLQPGSIDLLVGGTPCQSFSVAGLRKGLADPRGNLALVFLGLADKLKPRWIVWENVPGVLSSDGGRDFGSFLGALEQLGYGWAYRVLDAQYFGVPQRRRRVFVVASLGGRDVAASVLLKPESLCWHPAPRRKKGQATAADAGAGVEAGDILWSASDQPNAERYVDKAGTLNCNQGQRGGYICPVKSHWEGGDVHPTLNQAHNIGSPGYSNQELFSQKGAGLVPVPFRKYENHPNDSRITGPLDVAPTVVSRFGTGGGNVPLVNNEPITFQPGNLRREAGADPSTTTTTTLKASAGDQMPHVAYPVVPLDGMNLLSRLGPCGEEHSLQNFVAGDPSFTLKKGGSQHGVAIIAPCITASNDPSRSPQSSEVTQQVAAIHQATMAVRRLTPVECERLQGFPDNWSQIPWKGKPADQCPDGPRYKCAGNSMAVPVMRWIGEQIARVELSLNNPTK
jgi:DNA (cytosine-5)-methyltransferase 1